MTSPLPRPVALATCLYPRWWRERYGEECEGVSVDLLASGSSPWRIAASLLRGAITTRLRGTGIPATLPVLRARAKATVAVSTALLVVSVVLYAATLGATTIAPSVRLTAHSAPSVHVLRLLLVVMFVVVIVLFVMAAIGWRLVQSDLRGGRQWRLLALSWTPVAAPIVALIAGSWRVGTRPSMVSATGHIVHGHIIWSHVVTRGSEFWYVWGSVLMWDFGLQ